MKKFDKLIESVLNEKVDSKYFIDHLKKFDGVEDFVEILTDFAKKDMDAIDPSKDYKTIVAAISDHLDGDARELESRMVHDWSTADSKKYAKDVFLFVKDN